MIARAVVSERARLFLRMSFQIYLLSYSVGGAGFIRDKDSLEGRRVT